MEIIFDPVERVRRKYGNGLQRWETEQVFRAHYTRENPDSSVTSSWEALGTITFQEEDPEAGCELSSKNPDHIYPLTRDDLLKGCISHREVREIVLEAYKGLNLEDIQGE